MTDTNPKEVIETILETIEATYGNLGFLSFRMHSIKPNHAEGVYIIKYSFIPRSKDDERMFYYGKVNIKNKNIFEIKEIKEEDLAKDDN